MNKIYKDKLEQGCLDRLEAMLGKPDWKPSKERRELPKAITTPPDALVLMELTTVCRCGEEFSTPNKHLMLRFKENFLGMKPTMWRAEYNGLAREVKEVKLEVVTCQGCFSDTSFVREDF